MTHFRELTDRYTLEKILRSTRGGTVLRAVDNRTGQPVAIKLVTVTSPPLLVQKAPELEKLGDALESLREPSLPAVTDSGFTTDGSAFLVMELLEGKTLDALSASPQRLLGLLAQALDGLEALARRGIAHQNLSPDNLLVVGAPPAERVKLLGLGGALFRAPGAAPAETARFRAPEETGDAAGPVDWRVDLASFALTACHVLGANVVPSEPPSVQMPFTLSLELANAEALGKILEQCLRRNPAERPSHQEVRDAFRLALGALQAPPPAAPRPAAPLLVVPAPAAPAAPPPPEPAPPEDQELLSAIDDDILNALSAAPPAPASSGAPPAARVVPFRGAGAAAAAPPPAKPNPVLKPGVLIAVAAVLVLAAVGAFWWLSRGAAPRDAEQASAPAVPPPPPRRPATEVLAEAQGAMADENWDGALEALGSLTAADQALPHS
jgi:serine/threonine-protein kinase